MEGSTKRQFLVTEDLMASIPQRFGNYIIDVIMQLVLLIFIMIVSFIIGGILGSQKPIAFFTGLENNDVGLYTLTFGIALLYYNFFEIVTARTIGKFITKTIVVDEYGEKPSSETILIRSLCRLIPFEPLSVLIFQGRGWHDSISKTFVVDKRLLDQQKSQFHQTERQNHETNHDHN